MSTEKHTPGPWFKRSGVLMGADGSYVVADGLGLGLGSDNGDGVRTANARLIAAAPELLQELKNLRRAYVNLLETGRDRILLLGGQCDDVPTMEASDPYLRDASAAIAKATGAAS